VIRRAIAWCNDNIALAAILLGIALFLLDALVRGIAWSWFGATLPALFLGWH
jgi:hypothetical protein